MGRRFVVKGPEQVAAALRDHIERSEEQFDEEFSLLLTDEAYATRWKDRLGEPATARGYHMVMQNSTYYALALLRTGQKIERARKVVSRILEAQVRDTGHRRCGQFKAIYEALDCDVLDPNCTFFTCLGLIPIVKEYADVIGEERTGRIMEAFNLIPSREYKRDLGVSYTNAAIGSLAIRLIICDMLADRERFEVWRRHFDHFYDVNMTRGIPERHSRTYYTVDILALGLLLRYLKDEHVVTRARELLSIFLQEFLFFEDRQAIPARRTYNQNSGNALSHNALAWFLGAFDEGAEEWRGDGWVSLYESALTGTVDPNMFAMPAPRQMRGRHVDEAGYTSYFHKDFTLGTFDRWPPLTVGKQHESDIPVAFAGATSNLVYFGAYSVDAEGNLQTHPGTGKVGAPSRTVLPRLTYEASQHANVCVLLTNIKWLATEMKEYGWMLRGLQYEGRLFGSDGAQLSGAGAVEAQWVFLATDEYFAGVCPLSHFDPTGGDLLESAPTALRYEFGADKGLDIFAPNFQSEPPLDVKGNNMPAGAIFVLGSAKETGLDSFRAACLNTTIHDEWYVDGWNVREGYRDCERRVGISAPGAELRLSFDYLTDRLVSRTYNRRPMLAPTELSTVRLGVLPWVY